MISYLNSNIGTLQQDNSKCLEIVVNALKNGSLNLIIGAGVSLSTNSSPKRRKQKKYGFPNWRDLTINCCKDGGIDFDVSRSNQNKYLLQKLESARDYCTQNSIDFNSFVRQNLYKDVVYDINTLKTDLLIAIGSLIMNSSKSNLTSVINYNFDDVLEWYLTYYGFDLQIISDINSIICSSDTIFYHPHGFLPKSRIFEGFVTKDIILSNKDYIRASWNEDFWNSIQKNIVSSKINLFIGMSGEDPHVENICQYSYEKIICRERILGVMVQCIKERDADLEKQHNKNGIILYYINDYTDLPDFLLKIVRKARGIDFGNS